MIRIAVCDDSPDFLQRAVDMVERWSQQCGIPTEIYPFDNGDALLSKNAVTHMDIIFLDIIMPLQNGIDTAKELRQGDNAVKIIFLTSSPEFALESYEVKAQGYLLKPVTYEKIKETLDECSHNFETEAENIVLKTAFGYQKLYFHDMSGMAIYSRNFMILHMQGQEGHLEIKSDKMFCALKYLYLYQIISGEKGTHS